MEMKVAKKKKQVFSNTITIQNRKAFFEYEVIDKYEAGMELTGCEVKSLRLGQASLVESFVSLRTGQAFLKGMHINPYEQGNFMNADPYRDRRLLLKKDEINRLMGATTQKGLTVVPLKLYFNEKGWAKLQLGLCRGKKAHDKRQVIKERDIAREMQREMKNY